MHHAKANSGPEATNSFFENSSLPPLVLSPSEITLSILNTLKHQVLFEEGNFIRKAAKKFTLDEVAQDSA